MPTACWQIKRESGRGVGRVFRGEESSSVEVVPSNFLKISRKLLRKGGIH
jgi:hypothetical protein